MASPASSFSKDFFDLIKAIGESKSKQEEDRIIVNESAVLKKGTGERLTGKRLREFLVRLIYVEMLGHDASWGYMKVIEASASSNLMEKRVSYLTAGLCFSPDHEFRMMLVNRLQRDLQSSNVLEVGMALQASTKILTIDMIPAVLPIVTNLMKHDQEFVRKKAIMLLHRFYVLQNDSVSHMGAQFRRSLCDKDPAVMGASLHLFYELAKVDTAGYKDLVSSFVSILKQITEHRLPREFDYHRTPAPWIQLKLLRILAVLGRADQAASEQMYEVLLDVMRRADTGINVGYAIIYESVRTVTTIYPNNTLLDAAAAAIGRFISSDNHNLKYLGVMGLAAIVKDHPKYAAEHQLAVIDCLEDPDDTLKRKTLDLLYRMTNPFNVSVIVDRLMTQLKNAVDEFFRADLVARITQAAERFAPSNSWYIQTMIHVFELGGDLVRPDVAQNLVRLIAEGGGESEEVDAALRREAVEALLTQIDKPALPDILLQVMFWVLGEYGYLSGSMSLTDKVCSLAQRAGVETSTRSYALAAALKLTAQLGSLVPSAAALISKFSTSRHVDLSQRCVEFQALSSRPQLMQRVLPVDASTEDIEVDVNMTFLNGFVAEAEAAGARPYAPPAKEEESESHGNALRFDAYAKPDMNPMAALLDGAPAVPGGGFPPTADPLSQLGGPAATGVAQFGTFTAAAAKGGMWGKEGYKNAGGQTLQTPTAPQAPAPGGYSVPDTYTAAYTPAPAPADPYAQSAISRAPAPPPAPRELTEREKLAASLFGGPPAAPAPAPASTRAATTGVGASTKPAGFGSPATVTPSFGAKPNTPAGGGPAVVPAHAPAPIPAPAPAPAPPAPIDDLLDIFGGGAPAPAPAASMFGGGFSAPAPAGGDIFGLGGGFGAPAAFDLSGAPVPAVLNAVVATPGAVREPAAGNVSLPGDANVSIAYHKVFGADTLHIVLLVANSSASAPLPAATVTFQNVPFLQATLRSSPSAAPPSTTLAGPAANLGGLAPRTPACVIASCVLSALPPGATASINGSVAYSLASGAAGAPLQFSIPIHATDLLRPAPIDTAAFGGIWTQPAMRAEAAAPAACAIRTPAEYMAAISAKCHLAPVQAIDATSEAIAAGRLMAPASVAPVYILVHSRITPGSVDVRVKSADPGLTAAMLGSITARLKA